MQVLRDVGKGIVVQLDVGVEQVVNAAYVVFVRNPAVAKLVGAEI